MKHCNRCGRFRSQKTHVCLPVKVMKSDGKTIDYKFTMNAPKKNVSTKNSKSVTSRTRKRSRLVPGMFVGLSSLVLTVIGCTNLANADFTSNTEVYAAPKMEVSTSTPSKQTDIVPAVKPESIHDKITRYALKYDIPRKNLWQLVGCETSYQWDPTMQSNARYTFDDPKHGIKKGERERSYGLAMIHAPVHDIPIESITDPDFALDFIGKHWGERRQMWVNCTAKYGI